MKIKLPVQLQIVGWSIYWVLLLIINVFFFKKKDYNTFLVIVWTILFTICGLLVFYLLTKCYNYILRKNTAKVYAIILIILTSFIGAYIWGLFEPIISWLINPNILHLEITWDINSRRTFPFTFVVAFFSILYYFSKIIEQSKDQNKVESIKNEENVVSNETIAVYLKNDIVILSVKNIIKISIDGNYSRIVDNKNIKYELKKPLVKWENDLPKNTFIRIHRSTIININYIEKIEPWHNYTLRIKLQNIDEPEDVSRRYSALIKKDMNLKV